MVLTYFNDLMWCTPTSCRELTKQERHASSPRRGLFAYMCLPRHSLFWKSLAPLLPLHLLTYKFVCKRSYLTLHSSMPSNTNSHCLNFFTSKRLWLPKFQSQYRIGSLILCGRFSGISWRRPGTVHVHLVWLMFTPLVSVCKWFCTWYWWIH